MSSAKGFLRFGWLIGALASIRPDPPGAERAVPAAGPGHEQGGGSSPQAEGLLHTTLRNVIIPHFCQIGLKSAKRLRSYYSRHVARYRQAWTARSHKLHFIRKRS